jgi:hypothetical protein
MQPIRTHLKLNGLVAEWVRVRDEQQKRWSKKTRKLWTGHLRRHVLPVWH